MHASVKVPYRALHRAISLNQRPEWSLLLRLQLARVINAEVGRVIPAIQRGDPAGGRPAAAKVLALRRSGFLQGSRPASRPACATREPRRRQ